MTNDECCRGVCAKRLRDGLGARRSERGYNAFTLIELIVVVGVIIILTGLVLSTVGYARKKGARARAETEIAAISAACESYKADNGVYPTSSDTEGLSPQAMIDFPSYQKASLYLYTKLSGNLPSRQPSGTDKSYFAFKPNQLSPTDQ